MVDVYNIYFVNSYSLGATHDGDGYNSECRAVDNNIMAPTHGPLGRGTGLFFFSPCSERQIFNVVR